MSPEPNSSSSGSPRWTRHFRSRRLFLGLLSITLAAAFACGTDRATDDAVAAPFQIDGDMLSWSPPWEPGDSRSITTTASIELSPALQAMFDGFPGDDPGLEELTTPQTVTTGVISIVSKDSDGAKGELAVALEEVVKQLEMQMLGDQPGFGDSDFEQFAAIMGLLDQLNLGVEFGVDNSGALTGITNLAELTDTLGSFADSVMRFAALAGEEVIGADDRARLEKVLAELPDTETAQVLADAMLNASTANLFLMRSGDFSIGQSVVVSGNTRTAFGLPTNGLSTYELTDISNGTATVRVLVAPGEVDVLEMASRMAVEIAALLEEDATDFTDGIANLEPDELNIANALIGVLFEPYTVTLTLDAETGWVTAAEWSIELALPEGFAELLPEEDQDSMGSEFMDFGVTVHFSATFS